MVAKKSQRRRFRRAKKMKKIPTTILKLRDIQTVSSTAGGLIQDSNFLYDPSTCAQVTEMTALFDSYRVNGIKYTWTPINPYGGTPVYTPLYVTLDYDGTGPTTVASALQYKRTSVKDLSRPWTKYYRVPRIALSDPATQHLVMLSKGSKGYHDTAMLGQFAIGEITLNSQGLTASTTYGTLTVTYYVSCQNQK